MSANLEPVGAALLTLVQNMDTVYYATRYRTGLEQMSADRPCVVVTLAGASVFSQHNLPSRWSAMFWIVYGAKVPPGKEGDTPETLVNAWLVELQTDLAAATTLGGTCEHAWISGEVEVEPPTQDNPLVMCRVPVEVLVLG